MYPSENKIISNVSIECIKGDISSQTGITAVVNAANALLETGGGVAGAIHRAAGPGLAEECAPLAPIKPGEAVITSGQKLPNKYVIHCLGPVYGKNKPEDKLLADCYRNALNLADQHQIDSIAFPALSTGAFGYPVEEAAEIMFRTIKETIPALKFIRQIRIVLFNESDLKLHQNTMNRIL